MIPPPQPAWIEGNQRQLMNALAGVRRALENLVARAAAPAEAVGTASPFEPSPVSGPAEEELERSGAPSALNSVCAAFQLSRFERDLLLLCAGPDLDAKFGALIARAHGDPRRTAPTFGLALASLPEPHWSALLPTSPLRGWRLIEVGAGEALTGNSLRMDEWLLHFLAGTPHLDERLQPLVRPVAGSITPPVSHRALAEHVVRLCQSNPRGHSLPLIQLCGESPDDQLTVATHACAVLGARPFRLAATDAPTAAAERETFARLWEREAALGGGALLIDFREAELGDAARAALALLECINGLVFALTREPLRGTSRPAFKIEVTRPSISEQRELWQDFLGPQAAGLNGQLESVAGQFSLSTREIHEAAASSLAAAAGENHASVPADTALPLGPHLLWSQCRARSRARLETLAQRLEPAATWQDLVLPEAPLRTLREMAIHVRHRFRVYEQWGFASKGARGLGISALFAGPSGTGKTMAAEVLANELNLDLFRIDLSAVVSKYIGETEKNLRRVFDAAESGGAVLLFDEADALFGKRSEVKDSHDRYANIEVGYLLQRMETYRGLAILTTNFRQALDNAFLRRLRFIVQFPFPDATQRSEIWRRIFPAATPTDGLDPLRLGRLNVSGGNIRNIALNAAFLAADAGEPVRMRHLLQAARSECTKLERPPSEAELGGWV